MVTSPISVELCAGAGGQALGLEQAGFEHEALVEIDAHACATLRQNRPNWRVCEGDLAAFDGRAYKGADLLAGGLPCPPFSKAGKQLGKGDERNMFPEGLRLVDEIRPHAVMFENVRGFLDPVFAEYRAEITAHLRKLGYETKFKLLQASDYGVPQLRPRALIVALRSSFVDRFEWPKPHPLPPASVGSTLLDLMSAGGWLGARTWADRASSIAPTLVGGSKKHGGPDLGPTRARKAWASLGVDGLSLANTPPGPDFVGMPKLTLPMIARLQGFPDHWQFAGKKTHAYRQVGNAFPPPVAEAVAGQIYQALLGRNSHAGFRLMAG